MKDVSGVISIVTGTPYITCWSQPIVINGSLYLIGPARKTSVYRTDPTTYNEPLHTIGRLHGRLAVPLFLQ